MIKFQKIWFTLIVMGLSVLQNYACQAPPKPSQTYLQKLPRELCVELLQYTLGPDSLWKADVRVFNDAAHLADVALQTTEYNLKDIFITRMRKELAQAKMQLVEPYCNKLSLDDFLSLASGTSKSVTGSEKSSYSDDNPKNFQKLLHLEWVLAYCDYDQQWFKDFVHTKQWGGTLRKHLFITALTKKHEYLVNYLWNGNYRRKVIKDKLRNRPFLRMTNCAAKRAGYESIYNDLEAADGRIKAIIKASQVYYPG